MRSNAKVAFLCMFLVVISQAGESERPSVSLALPKPKTEVYYFLTGVFGGFGNFAQVDNLTSEIHASVNGSPAEAIKIVAYARGCSFMKMEARLHRADQLNRTLVCEPLNTVPLAGGFEMQAYVPESANLEVIYEADWINRYFGVMDGFVPSFLVASVKPSKTGEFRTVLPDFTNDPAIPKTPESGVLHFWLRDQKTGNIVGHLKPEGLNSVEMHPQGQYPSQMHFVLQKDMHFKAD